MKHTDFINLLESLTLLTDEQLHITQSAVDSYHPHSSQLIERIEKNFSGHPICHSCGNDAIRKYGFQKGRQRYQCKNCHHTFNALTSTPLAHLKKYGSWISISIA